MRIKPKVGDVLWMHMPSRWAKADGDLREVRVVSVARKYFTVEDGPIHRKFYIDNWHQATNVFPAARLYASEQGYKDEVEMREIRDWLREFFTTIRRHNLPLDALRALRDIIEVARTDG